MTCLNRCCRLLFCFVWFVSVIYASDIGHDERDRFSAFEKQMDKIADDYGNDYALALDKLKSIETAAIAEYEIATLRAYRCYLLSQLKQWSALEQEWHAAQEASRRFEDKAAALASEVLCQFHREHDPLTQQNLAAIAYYHAKHSTAPVLRYWISTNYVYYASKQGRGNDALEAAQLAYQIANANHDEYRIASSLRGLALLESDRDDHEAALEHIEKALQIVETLGLKQRAMDYTLNKGFILIAAGKLDAAEQTYAIASQKARALKQDDIDPIIWSNLADIAIQRQRFAEAKEWSEKVIAYAQRVNDRELEAYGQVSWAHAELYMGDKVQAYKRFESGIQYFISNKSWVDTRDMLLSWSEALAANRRYVDAYESLKRHNTIAADIDKESRGQAITEFREILRAEQRDRELVELRNSRLIESSRAEQADARRKQWIAFAFALSITLLWIAHTAWRVTQRNRLLLQQNQKLDTERYIDALTGLNNRGYFLSRADALARQAQRDSTELHSAVVFLLDIDFFKRINDRYGHAAGDAALVDVAQRLRACLREHDIVVRWGGEEFLIFSQSVPYERLPLFVSRVINSLAKSPLQYDNETIKLSASMGYAVVPTTLPDHTTLNLEEAIKLADAALYIAKSHGRNCAIGVRRVLTLSQGKDSLFNDLHGAWYRGEVELLVNAGLRIPLAHDI